MGKKKNKQNNKKESEFPEGSKKESGSNSEKKPQQKGTEPQQNANSGKSQTQQPKAQQSVNTCGQVQQHKPQQSVRDAGQVQQAQSAWGVGKPQQQNIPQPQQPGAWGLGKQQQQQKAPQPQQAGAWGGGQTQQPVARNVGKTPQQQQGAQQQKPSESQQGGAWGETHSQQGRQQQTERTHQSGPQQAGGWGRGQAQQQQTSRPQQAGGLGRGQAQQQTSGPQQAGGWGRGQAQQQKTSGPLQAGGGSQPPSGPRQDGRNDQNKPQQTGGDRQQQRTSYNRDERGGNESASLAQQMRGMSITDEKPLPLNKTSCNGIVRGTLGKPGIVEVNYLKLDIENMPNEAYHYDVTIEPDRPKKFLRPAFEQCRLKEFPNVLCAFDGMKNCYTLERLPHAIDCKLEVSDSNNRKKEFRVQIKETDNCLVDLSSLRTYQKDKVSDKPMRALQVLEVVLASGNHERGIRAGRSFFRRPDDSEDLGDGYEAWTGLYQAAILGELPFLNVDISHKSFPRESSLIDYLKNSGIDLNSDITQNNYNYKTVSSFLKGINITYTPPTNFGSISKQYKVVNIVEPASRKTFKNDDGKTLTVAEYFKSKGYALMYPNLNCLSVGSSVRPISLPMELCSIPGGQALNRKDQGRQVDKMVRYAATSTNRRKQKIMELLKFFDHNVHPIMRTFGIHIGTNFIKVPMRMLDAPFMEYLQGQTVTTNRGAWRMDNKKFLICSKPPNGHKWIILYEDDRRVRINHHDLENFKVKVINTSKSLNMNLIDKAEIAKFTYRDLSSTLRDLARDKYDLVFVVLSERGTPYSKIKQIAELEVGILTQCIKDKTIFRSNKDLTVFGNILLKVNGKLNGTNHKIAKSKGPDLLSPIKNVMYLGADVTHPSPDQRSIPSVVGVAASHDQNGACYNCQYRLQRSTLEEIEDMESIVNKHLEVYRRYQNSYPSQIIYYRDGVSDGQFPIIERKEILAIKRACKKLNFDPKITCIIVVKRHHTRFFPLTQPRDFKDFNNVQAGSVVDQHITHPNEVQFFMVSHQSIQGTARPTRYNVIFDESKFNIDLLQQLTYNLCHLFPRCNRAVSYPAPAYLAHLVAFRGRVYLEGTSHFGKLEAEYNKRRIKEDFMIRNPMYFI